MGTERYSITIADSAEGNATEKQELYGDLVSAVAVDINDDQFHGIIWSNDRVTDLDLVTLAKVTVEKVYGDIKDNQAAVDALRLNIAKVLEERSELWSRLLI